MDRLEGRGAQPAAFYTALSERISSGQLAHLELLYRKAPIGICLLDCDLLYISINETLASINGKLAEDHVGRSISEVIPEIAETFAPILRRAIKTGESALGLEFKCPAPGDPEKDRYWLVDLNPLKDDEEKVQAVSVMVRDITESKCIEMDLRRSGQLLQTLVESTKAVPWVADAKSKQFTYVGPQAVELLGYPIGSWFQENFWLEHIHPEDRKSSLDSRLLSFYRGLRDYEFEYRMITSKDDIVWIREIANIEWDAGEPRTLRGFMININFQKDVERTIKESEKRYREIVEDQTELICRFLPDGTLTFVNDAYCRCFSKKKEELIGSTFWTLIPAEHHDSCKKYLASLCNENPTSSIEHSVLMPNGEIRWQQWSDRAIFDEQGNIVEFQSVGRDITDRKRAEEALTQSEERYRNLFENVPAGIYRTTPDGRILMANPALIKMLRYSSFDEMTSLNLEEDQVFVTDYPRSKFKEMVEREDGVSGLESAWIRRDGSVIFVLESARAVRGNDGTVLYYEGTVEDITEQKRAQDVLRDSEERYRTLYENNPLMCFTTDPEGRVLYVNQLGAEQLGYTAEQLVGKSVVNVFYEDDKNKVLEQLSMCLQNPTHVAHWELRKVHKDGRILWVREFARVIHEMNGNKAILIACEDVTERKGAEQALQKALSEIGHLKDQLQAENIYLKEEIKSEQDYGEIVGNSQAIKAILLRAEKVAKTDSTILITGETGTGKELLARLIHNLSRRDIKTLVKVNCAAIPSALIESELFGREKGAYTGALTKQIGRFELANGSTIFLDEIGELSMELQSKLLRVLQDGEFERLGSPKTITVDVRVIAATNKDLARAVSESRFREDLYYRLNVFPIHVPPLRERIDDIPNLVWKFVKEFSDKMGKRIERIPKKTMDALLSYHWPGNIRELRNVIERAMILTRDNMLRVELPKTEILKNNTTMSLQETERAHILQVLKLTGWRVRGRNGAAEVLGLNPSTLESRMSKLGIVRHK